MKTEYDVAIIGASLAGASAALRLARAGLSVALIDKAIFPRRKPCGEGLSNYGLKQLESLGLRTKILSLPHLPYKGYRISAADTNVFIESPWHENITIQRTILDGQLIETCLQEKNITTYLGQAVTSVSLHTVYLAERELHAKYIVLASGSNSSLLKQIPHHETRYGPSRCGVSAIFKGRFSCEPDRILILLKRKYEVYCTPLADGRLNISILTLADSKLNIRELLLSDELLSEVFIQCSFSGELELAPEGRTNIGSVRRKSNTRQIYFAGDVKEEFDPIGGMGMSHALNSGIEAAEQIIKSSKSCFEESVTSYAPFPDEGTRAMRTFTTLTYQTLCNARQFPILLKLAASSLGTYVIKTLTKELA